MNLNKLKTADELTAKPEEAKPAETESEPVAEGEAPEGEAPEDEVDVTESVDPEAANPPDEKVQYITPGIARFKIGEYEFQNGTLSLTPAEAEAFDALLEELPPSESCRIQKVNLDGAAAIAAAFKATQSKMTAGVDTSDSGEAARQAAAE